MYFYRAFIQNRYRYIFGSQLGCSLSMSVSSTDSSRQRGLRLSDSYANIWLWQPVWNLSCPSVASSQNQTLNSRNKGTGGDSRHSLFSRAWEPGLRLEPGWGGTSVWLQVKHRSCCVCHTLVVFRLGSVHQRLFSVCRSAVAPNEQKYSRLNVLLLLPLPPCLLSVHC